MSTGSAKALLVFAILAALGGCASGKPQPILSAAELESMIRVEIRPLETDIPEAGITDETSVAAVQP
jgi:hypothetical protein